MANLNERERQISRGFRVSAVMLLFVLAMVMAATLFIYTTMKAMYNHDTESSEYVHRIQFEILNINENVLKLSAGFPDKEDYVQEIGKSFQAINEQESKWEKLGTKVGFTRTDKADMLIRRYNQAKLYIKAYDSKLQIMQTFMPDVASGKVSGDFMKGMYQQEIVPLQTTALEMIKAVENINELIGDERLHSVAMNHGIVQDLIIILIVAAEIAIEIMRRRTINNQRAIDLQAHEIQVAGERLEHSKEKMFDIALTNILTGMKNRYALENDLADRLETDQFNIGVFDLDNFRAINDTYGYEFGDEFLATIGEMLNSEYSNVAEIYNITGNEFCFIFHDDVPDSQAQRIADKIRITMTTPIEISGVVAQCGASGSIYHYLPNDSLNVSSLLIKMDTTLHNAKRNGGNMVYTVNSL